MVQDLCQGLKGGLDFGKVEHPATFGINGAGYVDCYSKRMPMQAATFMAIGYVWKVVRSLERELLENLHPNEFTRFTRRMIVGATTVGTSCGIANTLD
jgi:hypothetical protein